MKNHNEPIKYLAIYPSSPKMIRCPAGWTGRHLPSSNQFFYVLEGGFVLNVEDSSFFVRKGQLALLPTGKQHSFWMLPDNNLVMLDFSCRAECNGEDLFAFFGCNEGNLVVSIPEKEMLELYENMVTPLPPSLDAPRRITIISEYSRLCSMYVRARIGRENTKEEFAAVIDYMHAHITEDIALETLSDLMHFDTAYFSAKFKREAGVSPMKYFAQLRAKEAAKLLRNTDMPLSAVGASIGFTNTYYFKKFFEKNMGVRPEVYRDAFIEPPALRETKK